MDESSKASSVISTLRRLIAPTGPEAHLSAAVRQSLRAAGMELEAEQALTKGRVDFRVGSTAVELKVQGSAANVLRQLERYADDPSITDVVLVTTSAKHQRMPPSVGSKPLHVVYLPRL